MMRRQFTREDGSHLGRQGLGNKPKKTYWCPACHRKKVRWKMEFHYYECGVCTKKFHKRDVK